ncbi:MAG: shikimate kinase, partial [Hyphomicrobium denitrificans]|nr:shikimate kinase [Hyphomicrobium denitrificans]
MTESEAIDTAKKRLGKRSIVLVGLMGCGKSSIGKRLAARLGLPFIDADEEIERAAAKTINEIFADHGEAHFRDGERKVISRLLSNGPQVLATGGGAYMHPETRQRIRENGVSIWLRADLPVLMRRVMKRDTRPLLREGNPEATMRKLIEARYPIYAEADMTVDSRDEPHDLAVNEIVNRLATSSAVPTGPVQPPSPSRSVRIELGDRAYDVLIANGLLSDTGALIKSRLGAVKCGIVTDENVARHHLATLEESLKSEGLFAGSIVMKPGEGTKSFRDLATLSERLLELGLERGDLVVPLGGGVIGDLAGFAAGILRRGIRFVQIP